MQTLKFKSHFHNRVFRCRQSWLRSQATNLETQKHTKWIEITNQKPWPFEPVKVKFCVLRGPLRWLTAVKSTIISWLLNFKICMFVKSAVMLLLSTFSNCVEPAILYFRNFVPRFSLLPLSRSTRMGRREPREWGWYYYCNAGSCPPSLDSPHPVHATPFLWFYWK